MHHIRIKSQKADHGRESGEACGMQAVAAGWESNRGGQKPPERVQGSESLR